VGLGLTDVLTAMDGAAVESGVLAAKVYYPMTVDRLDSLHRELSSLSSASTSRLRWTATVMPPEHGPGSYWDPMQNPRILRALSNAPGLVGVHIASDYPQLDLQKTTTAVRGLALPDADLRRVVYENARGLLFKSLSRMVLQVPPRQKQKRPRE
jgi:hypothetical protein